MKSCLFIIILSLFLIFLPSAFACITPIVYNEYGVPVSIFGGYLTINGSKYPSDQAMITYNLSVNNTNKYSSITLTLAPGLDLLNYVYGSTVTVPARWKGVIGLNVYVDGNSKGGSLFVSGKCEDGQPIPEGVINVLVLGRGHSSPKFCGNTKNSCGTYPDCKDISNWNKCYDGYYRNYFCANNMIQYNSVCTSYCCGSFTQDGFCTGSPSTCYDPTPTCTDECAFEGTKCDENKVYTCIKEEDGCYDKILLEDCPSESLNCYFSQCINASAKIGSIAYLCNNDQCNDNLEPKLINWLNLNNWMVVGKAFNSWDVKELEDYDMIICSDELRACKVDARYGSYNAHMNNKRPFIEIADDRYAQASWKFGYVKNPNEYLSTGKSLYVTKTDDPIFFGINQMPQMFSIDKKFAVVPDYNLNSVLDLADVTTNNKKSTFFKTDETTTQGRFVYLGWFYGSSPTDLTEDGIKIFNRTLLWAACGDECLLGSIGNLPPVAKSKITPNPTGYDGQIISFDASASYDPEGKPLTYYWDFGDGTNSGWISEKTITHVYNRQGKYNITLIVNDGEISSKPYVSLLTILPAIKNKVAFLCGDISCSSQTEQEIIKFLSDNGYYVDKKIEYHLTQDELKDYDFIICASSPGCSVHIQSGVYNSYFNDRKGFVEIADYRYARAAVTFKYVSWYVGYPLKDADIILLNNSPITNGLSGHIYNSDKEIMGIFTSSVKVSTIAKLDYTKDISTMFVSDGEGNAGRYAFVGWIEKNSVSDLTNNGKQMLLRTIRWVQCGNVEGCK